MRSVLALLALVSTPVLAISIGLSLPDGNVWNSLTYTITVPPAPGPEVTTGPWFFWAGFQPSGGGVIQPVLQWGENPPSGWVNPDDVQPWFMVLWTVPASDKNNDQSDISQGVYAPQGSQIVSTVNNDGNGQWTQTSSVNGVSVGQTLSASQYFDTNEANFFVLESELYGQQISDWNFDVTFSDISITAQTSDGVSSVCGGTTSHSDGNGFISVNGYSLSGDGLTCHWDSMVLSPP